MKYGFWELTNRESRFAAVEHTIFIPRVSGYRQRLVFSGLRVQQPAFELNPQDVKMWGFLTPPPWDSSTTPLGCRFEELTRIKDSRFSHRPWVLPKFFDLPQADPWVNFKPPFTMPEYKSIEAAFSAKPKIANPIPTLLEDVRAIRERDKAYTDFLLRWITDTIVDDLISMFRNWLHDMFYVDYSYWLKRCSDLFQYVLSIFKQWLVFWLEGIYFD